MISRILRTGSPAVAPKGNRARLLSAGGATRPGREVMDLFANSCGANGPLRLDVTGPVPTQSVRCVFEQPYIMVGREPGNDLRLDNEQVSRRHAYMQMIAGRIFCIDLGSRTGIWWESRTRTVGWFDNPLR